MTVDVITLTKDLIRCPSVTPKDEGAQVFLAHVLESIGFTVTHLPFEDVPNIFARLGNSGPHLCYAGHTDVVPAGADDQWTYGAFEPTVKDGILYGRGASDMKGSVAAFTAAVAAFINKHGAPNGSISMLITGDEEGEAINGTVKVLEWMTQNNQIPDVALVGEPTNPDHHGQEVKVGRRGSLTGTLKISGKQGHVAYQHLANNPMPPLVKALDALACYEFDQGTEFFAPTNLEITTIDVGNTADNVIPQSGKAVFNIRFNDRWNAKTLETKLHEIIQQALGDRAYDLVTYSSAESFLTSDREWAKVVQAAVADVAGNVPALTTTGGTSDARFIQAYCPVVEYGVVNATIHQIDENTKVSDLEDLVQIYLHVLERYFDL